jgi:hypothetical protein
VANRGLPSTMSGKLAMKKLDIAELVRAYAGR